MIINVIFIFLLIRYITYSEIQMSQFKKTMLNQNQALVTMLNELRCSNEALKTALLQKNEIVAQSNSWNINFIVGVVFMGILLDCFVFLPHQPEYRINV